MTSKPLFPWCVTAALTENGLGCLTLLVLCWHNGAITIMMSHTLIPAPPQLTFFFLVLNTL